MEQRSENPIFGRKVFFINPPLQFENYVIEDLRNQEFEVYCIHDYKAAKSILKENKDAMCFIYIDDEMSYQSWFKYIKTFQYDDDLKSIFFGIISMKIKEKERQFFLLNSKLPGGFSLLTTPLDQLLVQFTNILNINGAKGRRQYIRLETSKVKEISGYMAAGAKLFPLEIQNISAVGLAITCAPNMLSLFVKNSVVENISLTLGKKTVIVSAVVFDSKIINNNCSVVLLLRNPSKMLKATIRSFIFEILDQRLKYTVSTVLQDTTDYEALELPSNSLEDVIIGDIETMNSDLASARSKILENEREVRAARDLEEL